jgi:flagellar motility protein MotE (MotC chaperone)
MKTNLFSPILVLLMLALFAKASMLFGRIQEQTTYSSNTNTSSILVDTAFATTHSSAPKEPEPKKEPEKSSLDGIILEEKDIKNLNEKNNITNNLSRSEMELLKDLSKRREKLDGEKKDISVREQILKATENKIDQKVVELKNLQNQLEDLIKQYDTKEQGKIMSLVKIYETMKPKDAAKIFNELEMPVLLRVVSNMKEVKVAPIIAGMDPMKARDLSIELARQKTID